jgi:hypothetical protein
VTPGEVALFMAELEGAFRGDLAEDREAAIRDQFGRVPFVEARAVIRSLVDQGHVWVPTPGELMTGLRRLAGSEHEFRRLRDGRSVREQEAVDRARLEAAAERLVARMRTELAE